MILLRLSPPNLSPIKNDTNVSLTKDSIHCNFDASNFSISTNKNSTSNKHQILDIMKTKLTLLVITLLFSSNLLAQKIVALHSPVNGVQYFSDDNPLQSAYEAAEIAGDTLYLPGGSMAPPAKFEKKLVIYGAGHYEEATTATYKTIISGNVILSEEASGFHLEGVKISGQIQFDNNESINDVTIKRCKINSNGIYVAGDRTNPSENNTFVENVISGLNYIDNLTNSMFFNNIIEGSVGSARNLIFLNNVFNYSYYYSNTVSYANNCMFKNNIFLEESASLCGGSGSSTWSHNIFCNTSGTIPSLGVDPILDSNYILTRADVLVDQSDGIFDYTDDYHLQAGAGLPTYPGDDGYETGIYGGFYPWKNFSIPVNPHVSSKTISSTSDTSGNIQVDINVHAQDR